MGRDRYERVLRICCQDDLDLNGLMVSEGHAVAYRRYPRRYVAEENAARKAGKGA